MATVANSAEKNYPDEKQKRIYLTPTGLLMEGHYTQNALMGRGIANGFPQVIGFTNSIHIFDDETSAFEHPAELQVGFRARDGVDYPLHANELAERHVPLRQ